MRRDFRLHDNPALKAAQESGRPIIPVFILDEVINSFGSAPKWRLGKALECFNSTLEAIGSRLMIKKGNALEILLELIEETGAKSVYWSRAYDPIAISRDKIVKAGIKSINLEAKSFKGFLVFEPWLAKTKAGTFFKVYSPMWRSLQDITVDPEVKEVTSLNTPEEWPKSLNLVDLSLFKGMNRGAQIVEKFTTIGERKALAKLNNFLGKKINDYKDKRNNLDEDFCSGLSENLTYGEISARRMWFAAENSKQLGMRGAEHFQKEIAWREFAYHLAYHTPQIETDNWRSEWNAFPWKGNCEDAEKWRQGQTGEPLIDAAMRELYITGKMHNRARMLVASYLTKHLLIDWRIGKEWFEETLIDWDPASNAMGWQWVAGSGPDAAPYFRIFNPQGQAEKFDEKRVYRNSYLNAGCEGSERALSFFDAIPKSWNLSCKDSYPKPLIDLKVGRERALLAYKSLKSEDNEKFS
jgi:deoxyribodipyrimidine photo-lyase